MLIKQCDLCKNIFDKLFPLNAVSFFRHKDSGFSEAELRIELCDECYQNLMKHIKDDIKEAELMLTNGRIKKGK